MLQGQLLRVFTLENRQIFVQRIQRKIVEVFEVVTGESCLPVDREIVTIHDLGRWVGNLDCTFENFRSHLRIWGSCHTSKSLETARLVHWEDQVDIFARIKGVEQLSCRSTCRRPHIVLERQLHWFDIETFHDKKASFFCDKGTHFYFLLQNFHFLLVDLIDISLVVWLCTRFCLMSKGCLLSWIILLIFVVILLFWTLLCWVLLKIQVLIGVLLSCHLLLFRLLSTMSVSRYICGSQLILLSKFVAVIAIILMRILIHLAFKGGRIVTCTTICYPFWAFR